MHDTGCLGLVHWDPSPSAGDLRELPRMPLHPVAVRSSKPVACVPQGPGEPLRGVWEHGAASKEGRRLPQQRHVVPLLGEDAVPVPPAPTPQGLLETSHPRIAVAYSPFLH